MARLMRAIRSGAASAAILFWTGAAIAAPPAQDAQQVAGDRESPEDYGWIDRADALWDAIGSAPPDYSFAFDDGQSRGEPWAWETSDGYWIVVEDTPQGMRSYYFAPDAAGPFLAREAENSFGYDDDDGEVAMVYDAGGGALPRAQGAAYIDEGEALYDRGVRLLRVLRQRNWEPVNTTAWVDLSFVLIGLQHQWDEGRNRHAGWRRHRELPRVIAEHRRWDSEQRRRADAAERFRRWRAGGFQGKPPGRPGGWVQGPHRPSRPDGQVGRPGRWTPATGPQPLPTNLSGPPQPPRRAPGSRIPPGKVTNTPVDNDVADPVAVAPAPARPDRSGGRAGGNRPWRDRGVGARPAPVVPAAPVVAAPAAQPPAPTRPIFRPRPTADGAPARGQGATRPAFTPRQRPAPPAAGAGAPQRPTTAPPAQRPAAAPAPRPAAPRPAPPPRPPKIDRGDSGKVD